MLPFATPLPLLVIYCMFLLFYAHKGYYYYCYYILENKTDVLGIKEAWIMVNLKIHFCLPNFHPIMFFLSIMASLISPMVVVLLLLNRNLFIILLHPILFFPYLNALVP